MAASRSRPSPDLADRFAATLAAHTRAGQRVRVGFSGGLDSTVLLHLFVVTRAQHGLELSAAHVHHGLQAAADNWPAHCAAVCQAWGLPFHALHVSVARDDPHGIEAAAREARHRALADPAYDWVALAHHRGDQAETLLHRLTRGAGVSGAAAMRPSDLRTRPALLRPLLDEPRETLEAWARAHALSWVEDPSNAELAISRNYLRHRVLAPLSERFPGAEGALARAAAHFAQADGLLRELAALDHAAVGGAGQPAALEALRTLSPARQANLLRARIGSLGRQAPDARQLDEALRQLAAATPPWRLGCADWALCADDGMVWFECDLPPPAAPALRWNGEPVITWGGWTLSFEPDDGPGALRLEPGRTEVRARAAGDRLRPVAGRPSRDFKTLAREAGIPEWWRGGLPVVAMEGRPVWFAGQRSADAAGPGWRVLWAGLPPRRF